jgi:anhydro-N-acetylmuramic acid kinase
MNSNIEKLYTAARKNTRRIIGLMSGTSLDGLDVALCRFEGSSGSTQVTLERFETIVYSEDFKDEIRKVFAKKEIDFQHLCLLNAYIGRSHGRMVLECLSQWQIPPAEVDAVASHGQTVMHTPKILHGLDKFSNATLQIGDGDHIAVETGIMTLSDFRQKHVAAGGEGAPLAVYGDYLMFSEATQNRIMLNMGGIANFTYLPANLNSNEVFTTDTGPGNTIIDAFAREYYGLAYDKNGEIAASGQSNSDLLMALKDDGFFKQAFPKTTGPELFNIDFVRLAQQKSNTNTLATADIMATLTRFSAETIAEQILKATDAAQQYYVYMSGGGMHNPVLVRMLHELLPNFTFGSTNDLGISGDAKEAVLFAVLANESLAGGRTHFGGRRGVPSVSMGKISFSH